MKKAGMNKKREANEYEWYSDEADYFYCRDMRDLSCQLHFHSSWEFIFVVEGRLRLLLDGEEYCAKKGDVLFIPGFVVHYAAGTEKNRCFSLVFGSDYKRAFTEEFGEKQFDFILPYIEGRSEEIFRFVEECVKNFKSFSACERFGMTSMFLGAFGRMYPLKEAENQSSDKLIIDLLRYLDKHFTENISVESVAERFGYSKNYLSTLFNKYTGMRFSDYLNRLRIRETVKRMENSSVGITSVALDCGFNSLNTYYRAKRKFLTNKK